MANILVFSYVNVHCINVSFLLGRKKIAYNSAGDHSLCIGYFSVLFACSHRKLWIIVIFSDVEMRKLSAQIVTQQMMWL